MLKNIQYFSGQEGKKVAFQYRKSGNTSMTTAKGTVLILSGLMETTLKYEYWIDTLNKLDLDVLILDNRGMGFSERLLPSDPMKVHVESFDYYVEDCLTLLRKFQDQTSQPLYLLTHSTGGLIGTHLLARCGATKEFQFEHAIFSAPLYDVYARGLPSSSIRRLLKTMLLFYKQSAYLLGYSKNSYLKRDFAAAKFTHDYALFEMDSVILQENPQARANGPTYQWLKQILKGCSRLKKVIPKIDCHVDILQAHRDYYVSNKAHTKLQKYFKSCNVHSIRGSYHEILMEIQPIRDEVEEIIQNSFTRSTTDR